METGIVVIITIILVICIVPFILINGSTKKTKKELKKGLEAGVSDNKGTLTDFVINNNFALGLDRISQQIYYYKKTPKAECLQIVNLATISGCEVQQETKRVGKAKYELIKSIALVFTFTKNNTIEAFEFYDYNDTTQLNGELALADIWKDKVIDLLTQETKSLEDSTIQKTALKFA